MVDPEADIVGLEVDNEDLGVEVDMVDPKVMEADIVGLGVDKENIAD